MGCAAHSELQLGKLMWTHLWIDHMYFFYKEVENLVKVLLRCHRGESLEAESHVAQQRGPKPPPGRLGVQVVVDNHTIDGSLAAHGWDATKRAKNRQGPISVQRYASRTRRRLLFDMQHLQTLERRFRCRKKRL